MNQVSTVRNNDLEGKLAEITEQVRTNGGFNFYVDEYNTKDKLNDYGIRDYGLNSNVKGIHNIKKAEGDWGSNSLPLTDSIGGSIGTDDSDSGITEFDVVVYGPLVKDKNELIKEGGKTWYGKTIYPKHERSLEKNIPLNEIIDTDSTEQAYFLSLTLRTPIELKEETWDGRTTSESVPCLNIVGNGDLIYDIVSYMQSIKTHEDYMNFVKSIAPSDEFPNINENIIEKAEAGEYVKLINTAYAYRDTETDEKFIDLREHLRKYKGMTQEFYKRGYNIYFSDPKQDNPVVNIPVVNTPEVSYEASGSTPEIKSEFAPQIYNYTDENLPVVYDDDLEQDVLEPVIKPIYQVEQPVVDDEQFVLDSMDILLGQSD